MVRLRIIIKSNGITGGNIPVLLSGKEKGGGSAGQNKDYSGRTRIKIIWM